MIALNIRCPDSPLQFGTACFRLGRVARRTLIDMGPRDLDADSSLEPGQHGADGVDDQLCLPKTTSG